MSEKINWTKTSEGLPACDDGDRVIAVIAVQNQKTKVAHYQTTILIATETGWDNEFGLDVNQTEAWIMERDFDSVVADVLGPASDRFEDHD